MIRRVRGWITRLVSYRATGWSDDPVTSDFADVYTSRQNSDQVVVMQDLQDWIDVLGQDTGCKCEKCVCTPCQDDRLRVLRVASEEIIRLQGEVTRLTTFIQSIGITVDQEVRGE